jgi:cell wall-associated NlpC family hydrolase
MKKHFAIGAIAIALLAYSTPAAGTQRVRLVPPPLVQQQTSFQWLVEHKIEQTKLEQESAHQQTVESNTEKLNNVIEALTDRVGKTRYVFSGSTPKGWDCSGMVLWAYSKLGVELEHSASKQQYAGKAVKEPKLGDIVVFKYNGRGSAYHVGIYLYPDTMIHSGGEPGDVTSIVSISRFAGKHSQVLFKRVIETQ